MENPHWILLTLLYHTLPYTGDIITLRQELLRRVGARNVSYVAKHTVFKSQ